ncbi:hypothetical protein KUTeg_007883 [Tegillarca granosa]|uniref:Gasdermin pore forming domain-containing protein n=1 Tax=Tegillarca granosa TaxID=220873 RepID=A0ABQ9FJ39_TEGGR|nr:hypothetical protein KUTeg_007883 [Tegillarca granosa]
MKKEKRKFLFWKKKCYIPYNIPLQDLLVSGKPLNVNPAIDDVFCTYNKDSTFSLSGKFGAGIMAELMDVTLSASDSVKVKADLGDVTKKEVDPISLIEALKDRQLNTSHTFVKQICGNRKKVLCVVIAVLSLCKDAGISRIDDVEADADVKANLPRTSSAEGEGKFDDKKNRQIGLPKGTVLAYKIVELKINLLTGNIEPIIAKDDTGGFYGGGKLTSMDSPDRDIEVDGLMDDLGFKDIISTLQPIVILDTETRKDVSSIIIKMMKFPSNINVISDLLSDGEDKLDSENKEHVVKLKSLEGILQIPKEQWMRLLEIIGFKPKSDGELLLSGEPSQLLIAFGHVFDALMELSIDDLELLESCSDDARKALLCLCKSTMNGQPMIELADKSQIISRDDQGKKLAERVGYKFTVTNLTVANGPEKPSPVIEQLSWVLYAMYGQ